jgi:hypothetical protein
MRRVFTVALSVLAIVAMLAPAAMAQAPAPKVTINGLVDNMATYTKNISLVDGNLDKNGDDELYARTRVRPDITAEVGTTKFVLGLEIDATWGQTGGADSTVTGGLVGGAGGPQRFGTTGGWDINTDLVGTIEVKWAYTEFDIPGTPFGWRVRLGAQPFATTYKLIHASGDFAGLNSVMTFTPNVKWHFTYAQVEEESTGSRDGFLRGDDYAVITSVEITPFKGLDLRPLYSYFWAEGATNGAARQGRGGAVTIPATATESRHTIGLDARWRSGPFTFEPTVLYQFGTREVASPGTTAIGEQDRSAWLIDLRGGFQAGPLLLEAAGIYTSGNRANDDVRLAGRDINFYEPISTDTGYYATWAEHWALGIDYFSAMRESSGGLCTCVGIGYDTYGLWRIGGRASYALTPAFTLRTAVTANWTAHSVDTNNGSTIALATGITPGDFRGDHSYLGTEIDLGFQWRLQPNVAMDVVGAYTFAGPALAATTGPGGRDANNPENIISAIARVRYTF